jgi:hypothetical protein
MIEVYHESHSQFQGEINLLKNMIADEHERSDEFQSEMKSIKNVIEGSYESCAQVKNEMLSESEVTKTRAIFDNRVISIRMRVGEEHRMNIMASEDQRSDYSYNDDVSVKNIRKEKNLHFCSPNFFFNLHDDEPVKKKARGKKGRRGGNVSKHRESHIKIYTEKLDYRKVQARVDSWLQRNTALGEVRVKLYEPRLDFRKVKAKVDTRGNKILRRDEVHVPIYSRQRDYSKVRAKINNRW